MLQLNTRQQKQQDLKNGDYQTIETIQDVLRKSYKTLSGADGRRPYETEWYTSSNTADIVSNIKT